MLQHEKSVSNLNLRQCLSLTAWILHPETNAVEAQSIGQECLWYQLEMGLGKAISSL